MLTNTDPSAEQSRGIFKNPLLYSSLALLSAALAVGWILYSRWESSRLIDQRLQEDRARQQRESDRAAIEQLGGNELAIQSFYASPGAIQRGETTHLCYGVANAKSVKLEPQPEPVWPSYGHCVRVNPPKTTTYTLTIADASGKTLSQSVEVTVR